MQMRKEPITIKEALETCVCFSHFIYLMFDKPIYKVKQILGGECLMPFRRIYDKNKLKLI